MPPGPPSHRSSAIRAAAIETVKRFQAAGVDELILVMDLGTVPHEMVTESMRTFAERVMPQFT